MKAAIVRRVSTEKEVQENSLQNQKDYFEDYCLAKGWDVCKIYTESESGTKFNRKEMNRLIADAKARKFDIILAKELSRLARNQRLALEIKEVIEKHHIHLVTLDGAIDTTTGNTHMFGLFAWIYEQEAQRTSERIKMALETKAKKGQFKGSIAPYGYVVREGKLYISDDGSAEVVKRIFQHYLEGKGFDAIARELFEQDVPTSSMLANKKKQTIYWHGSSVRKILENPHYTGDMVQGRQSTISVTNKSRKNKPETEFIVVKNTHEPIISRDVFESVQQLIAFNRKKSVSNPDVCSRPHQNVHLFTGVIFCPDCGSGFHYKRNGACYICGLSDKLGDKACSKHRIKEDTLISIIRGDLQKLSKLLDDQSFYNAVRDRFIKAKVKLEKELKACAVKIENIRKLKSKALSKYLEEAITKADYDDYIAAQDEEIEKLLHNKEKLEAALTTSVDASVLDKIKGIVVSALEFKEINREVISRFIEKIEVTADGTVKLYYRFAGTSKILNELLADVS
ncbi:recombinase family protein [Cohnella yongneupensis]|uniref:Recombinase family protein n=1 Tax=Cohnella yongneupensis TaxID=425006 RepID=A0ABW0R063_9BACL